MASIFVNIRDWLMTNTSYYKDKLRIPTACLFMAKSISSIKEIDYWIISLITRIIFEFLQLAFLWQRGSVNLRDWLLTNDSYNKDNWRIPRVSLPYFMARNICWYMRLMLWLMSPLSRMIGDLI